MTATPAAAPAAVGTPFALGHLRYDVVSCVGELVLRHEEVDVPRLTITLSEQRHRALKESALRRGTTIGALIDASLDAYGVKTTATAAELVARARAQAAIDEAAALALAVDETRAARRA